MLSLVPSPTISTLPTYTLPSVKGLDPPLPSQPLYPAAIAAFAGVIITVLCVAAVCTVGNVRRGVVYRKDVDDCEDWDEKSTSRRSGFSSALDTELHNIQGDARDDERHINTRPNIRGSLPLPTSHPSVHLDAPPAAHLPPELRSRPRSPVPMNRSLLLQVPSRTPHPPSSSYSSREMPMPSENGKDLGLGSVGLDMPSRLALGSEREGLVGLGAVKDRRFTAIGY